MKKTDSIKKLIQMRPRTCEKTGAHWDVKGKCFFCGLPIHVVHVDKIEVEEVRKTA